MHATTSRVFSAVFLALWKLGAEQVVTGPTDAKVVVEKLVVCIMGICAKEMIATVAAARLEQGQSKPKVRCVRVGVGDEWPQRNAENVAGDELDRMRKNRRCSTRRRPFVVDLVNRTVEPSVMDEAMAPVEPQIYNHYADKDIDEFPLQIKGVVLLQTHKQPSKPRRPNLLVIYAQQRCNDHQIQHRDARCINPLGEGKVFPLDFACCQRFNNSICGRVG